MIERTVVASKIKEFQIEEYVKQNLKKVGHSHTTLQRTPLGEKVVIYASRPGLIVGRQGESIRQLTKDIKNDFKLENPQIEVAEVGNIYLDANIVSELIAGSLERFGPDRFKATMHHALENVLKAGAQGVEIIMSGKLPSKRAKSWRVYGGHLKKSGDLENVGVVQAITTAELKSGTIGIKVSIMPPNLIMPDNVSFKKEPVAQELAVGQTPVAAAVAEGAETGTETTIAEAPAGEEKSAKEAKKKAAPKKKRAPKKVALEGGAAEPPIQPPQEQADAPSISSSGSEDNENAEERGDNS